MEAVGRQEEGVSSYWDIIRGREENWN